MNQRRSFWKTGVLVIAGVLYFGLFTVPCHAQSSVTINVEGAEHVVQNSMYGSLMERLGRQWGNGRNGGIWVGTSSNIPNTNGMRNDVIAALKECGLGAAQWPGGCAAWAYSWNPPNPSNDVGTDRFLEFCKLVGASR